MRRPFSRRAKRTALTLLLAMLASALLAVASLNAQEPAAGGSVPGLPLAEVLSRPESAPEEIERDHAEEMRRFVQAVSDYAKGIAPDFAVVPIDGLALLKKTRVTAGLDAETITVDAVAYRRAIDGVMARGLYFQADPLGKVTSDEARKQREPILDRARADGLTPLVMDFAVEPEKVETVLRLSDRNGYIPFVAPASGLALNALPPYPARPHHENSRTIRSLREVRNFVCLRDSSAFGTQPQFAMALHDTNYDLVIVDVFHRGTEPLTPQAVETLKYKKLGARRLVFAYVNIGEAEAYRHYWKPDWQPGAPAWILGPVADAGDRYLVEYWRPEWQQIIFGNPNSYLYGIIKDLGFDGVVLDGIGVYRHFQTKDGLGL